MRGWVGTRTYMGMDMKKERFFRSNYAIVIPGLLEVPSHTFPADYLLHFFRLPIPANFTAERALCGDFFLYNCAITITGVIAE